MAPKRYVEKGIVWGAGLAIAAALVVRLFFTISLYDEVLNIRISYLTAVMGQRHLVENAQLFAMGDVFNLPFVWIYYKLTGGMAGIVLFMRFVYVGFNLVLSGVFFCVFSSCMGKRNAILFSLILVSYAPFSVYSVWYDSAALFFMLMGAVLYAGSVLGEGSKSRWMRYFSGLSHGCMVYAYPTMALVALMTLLIGIVCTVRRKGRLKSVMPYVLGGLTVIMVFCAYCTCVGWGNICFFQEGYLQRNLGGRGLETATAGNIGLCSQGIQVVKEAAWDVAASRETAGAAPVLLSGAGSFFHSLVIKLKQIAKECIGQQLQTVPITVLLLIQWAVGLKKRGAVRLFLLVEIILATGFWHRDMGQGQWAMLTAYAYYACWAPFLFCYLRDRAREVGKVLFCFLWLTSCGAFLAVGFTATYSQKAAMGLYAGAVCTLLFMALIAVQTPVRGRELAAGVILLAAVVNVALVYGNAYGDDRISRCSYRMKDGVFRGIYTEPENEKYDKAEQKVRALNLPDGTMVCLPYEEYDYEPILMWGKFEQGGTDFQTAERQLEEGADVEALIARSPWADLLVTTKEIYEECPLTREKITDLYYQLVITEGDLLFFRKEMR